MSIKRPTTVKVGPFTYDIIYDAGILREKDPGLVGQTHHRNQQIIIRDDQVEDQIRDTLIHEIFHIIWVVAGLHERENMTQEENIAAISPNLLEVLRANPDLVPYLLSQ